MHSYFYKFLFLMIYSVSLPMAAIPNVSGSRSVAFGSLAVVLVSFWAFVWFTAVEARYLDALGQSRARRSLLILLVFVLVSAVFSIGFGRMLSPQSDALLGGIVLVVVFSIGFFGSIWLSPLAFNNQNNFGYLIPGGYGASVTSILGLAAFDDGWVLGQALDQLEWVIIWSAWCWLMFEVGITRWSIPEQSEGSSLGKAMSLSFLNDDES